MKLTVLPLAPERWPDLEALFNARGCSVARGCWCMYYRRSGSRSALPAGTTQAMANRADLKALVDAGRPPGLIGYRDGVPVGWVSLGPRQEFAKLVRSPVMKAVDEQPVWSIICFVVPSEYRGQGIAQAFSPARSPTRGNEASPCSRLIRWTKPNDPLTMQCGSARSRCTTVPDSPRWRGEDRIGRSSGSQWCEISPSWARIVDCQQRPRHAPAAGRRLRRPGCGMTAALR